jgi:hypothetical protein
VTSSISPSGKAQILREFYKSAIGFNELARFVNEKNAAANRSRGAYALCKIRENQHTYAVAVEVP